MAEDGPPPANAAHSLLVRLSNQVLSLRSKVTTVVAAANPAALGSFVATQALRPLSLAASLLESRGAYVNVSLNVQLGRRPVGEEKGREVLNVQLGGRTEEDEGRDATTRSLEVMRIEGEIARLAARLEELRRMEE